MFNNSTQDSHSGRTSSLVLPSDYTMVKFLPREDPCWGKRTSWLHQDPQSEPAVCNVGKRDDQIAKEDTRYYSEISSQWIKSRMLDWVVSRLYYEQASAIFTYYGKKEKGRLKQSFSANALTNTDREICREKLWTRAVLQLAGFQMSSDVSLSNVKHLLHEAVWKWWSCYYCPIHWGCVEHIRVSF